MVAAPTRLDVPLCAVRSHAAKYKRSTSAAPPRTSVKAKIAQRGNPPLVPSGKSDNASPILDPTLVVTLANISHYGCLTITETFPKGVGATMSAGILQL